MEPKGFAPLFLLGNCSSHPAGATVLVTKRQAFSPATFRTNHVRLSQRYRIADKKRAYALPNTQHHQFRIILQCRFYRKNHSDIYLPDSYNCSSSSSFRPSKRYAESKPLLISALLYSVITPELFADDILTDFKQLF